MFEENSPLVADPVDPRCVASVVVPAKDEAASIPAMLNALAAQRDLSGVKLPLDSYEVVLLLNNCTDASAEVACEWRRAHPAMRLHIVEQTLPPERAHVGTARRLLMDTAWHRLHGSKMQVCGILTTDSDTVVAQDWIVRNLDALEQGADAVGGVIHVSDRDLKQLSPGVREAYERDRHYQRLVAEIEGCLDPQLGDPWPRHLDHFGASLSCTPQAYARAGGMPAVSSLEDVAFVDALRRSGARLRHDPMVRVFTSLRLEGRATEGLSGQLRTWQRMSDEGSEHTVASAAWLMHRFRTLRLLREFYVSWQAETLALYPPHWKMRLAEAHTHSRSVADFLLRCDCDRLISETFHGAREASIVQVNCDLSRALDGLRQAAQQRLARQVCYAGATD